MSQNASPQSCQPMPPAARQPTATPWTHHTLLRFGEYEIRGSAGEELATVYASDGGDEPVAYPGEANAAFIVEAVNSHASLKARIEELEGALRNMMGAFDTPIARRRFPPDDFMREALESARAALPKQEPGK